MMQSCAFRMSYENRRGKLAFALFIAVIYYPVKIIVRFFKIMMVLKKSTCLIFFLQATIKCLKGMESVFLCDRLPCIFFFYRQFTNLALQPFLFKLVLQSLMSND